MAQAWAPEGSAAEAGAERLIRLPNGYHCFRPPVDAPDVSDLPAERNGLITFGCFNRNPKISGDTERAWIEILRAVPDSRLLLKSKWFLDPAVQQGYRDRFEQGGIDEDRIVFLPWEERAADSLAVYADVDIALDTFPYNGTTTTCEALWMGVPVVVRIGESQAARTGFSLLKQAGLDDWVTADTASYVRWAVDLASDVERLKSLRRTLRDRVSNSPLMDGAGFARTMEDALVRVWTETIGVHLPSTEPVAKQAKPGAKAVEKQGVLYVLWGERGESFLERSRESLRRIHPELPVSVIRLPAGSNLLDKARLYRETPFERTLYLDVDTVVLDDLEFGFEMADRTGLACCICECPWARRYPSMKGDLVEYNTGVLFFTGKALPVMRKWEELAPVVDSSIRLRINGQDGVMPLNDQAAFAQAVLEWDRQPFILPVNWNFRPQWHRSLFGPLKIWHDYREVPLSVRQWCANQKQPNAIIQYLELPPGTP